MANFLQSSIDAYNRGWQQRYGGGRRPGPMADPVANNPAIGAPIGAKDDKEFNPHPGWDPKDPTRPPYTIPFYPQGPIWKEGPPPTYPQPQPTPLQPPMPVASNPAMGAPVGAGLNWERRGGTGYNEYHSAEGPSGTQYTVYNHPNHGWSVRMAQKGDYGPGLGPTHTLHGYSDRDTAMGVAHHTEHFWGGRNPGLSEAAPVSSNPAMGAPLGAPAPISHNPEVGQFDLGAFFQNLFGGGQAPQMNSPGLPTNIGIAQPGSDYESSLAGMGPAGQWPTGSTVSPGNYVLGPSTDGQAGEILATGKDATATPGGGGMGGMMGAGQIGSLLGNAISSWGKNQPDFKYTEDTVPLPKVAYFTPPTLSPNQNASY